MTCDHFRFSAPAVERSGIGLGVAALVYAALGHAVVPLERGGKRPHRMLPTDGGGGVRHASADPIVISGWWRTDPAANIGVATGAISRLAVIDLDIKDADNGVNGVNSFLGFLRGSNYPMPDPACWAGTPSGGRHLWLRTPAGADVRERPGILPGVDVKGDGGLVVVPPSMKLVAPIRGSDGTGGGDPLPVPYAWLGLCPACGVPDAPGWLAHWLMTAPVLGSPKGTDDVDIPDIEDARRTGVAVGERNVVTYRLACRMYRQLGTGPDASATVWGHLEAIWRAGDTSGMTRSELSRIAESARKFIVRAQAADDEAYEQLRGYSRWW